MKKNIWTVIFYVFFGIFSANAHDLIVFKDGTMIEGKVMEIHPTEIRYKRSDNLNGPMIIIPADKVLTIRYENGVIDIINAAGQGSAQTGYSSSAGQQDSMTAALQNILNAMPAITIAGNSLKFQFNGDSWTAMLNGENFSTGTVRNEGTNDSSILTLKQTHIWPGAAAKTTGRIAGKIPGAGAVGGVTNAAGSVAGAVGAVEASGPDIVLEYKAGPPAKLSYLRSQAATASGAAVSGAAIPTDAAWKPNADNTSWIKTNSGTEYIDGTERDVLSVECKLGAGSATQYRYAEIQLFDEAIVQTLKQSSGMRLKVLGDGKPWILYILSGGTVSADPDSNASNNAYYQEKILTKKGKVVQIDIPFSKLKQVSWQSKRIKFDKNTISGLFIAKDNANPGSSTIKIFDFEIY